MCAGSGTAYWASEYSTSARLSKEHYFVYRALGGEPERELAWNRALHWTPRECDPNAGRTPSNLEAREPGDYVQRLYLAGEPGAQSWEEHGWAADHASNHIGGTMLPSQQVPPFSAYYVEFGEELGGYNFGGGIAQLDFGDMKFDWACG